MTSQHETTWRTAFTVLSIPILIAGIVVSFLNGQFVWGVLCAALLINAVSRIQRLGVEGSLKRTRCR
jgi:hypothetical protein